VTEHNHQSKPLGSFRLPLDPQTTERLALIKQHVRSDPEMGEATRRLARHSYVPSERRPLPSLFQEVRDYVLNSRGDPKLRENVVACEVWLTKELGTPLWDPAYGSPKQRRRRQRQSPRQNQILRLAQNHSISASTPAQLRKRIKPHWNSEKFGELPDWHTFDEALVKLQELQNRN
jgi:hypothetical protein